MHPMCIGISILIWEDEGYQRLNEAVGDGVWRLYVALFMQARQPPPLSFDLLV